MTLHKMVCLLLRVAIRFSLIVPFVWVKFFIRQFGQVGEISLVPSDTKSNSTDGVEIVSKYVTFEF